MSDEPGHASAVNEQLRQAEEDDELPASTADRSSLRLAVDGELLAADNPIDYLVLLLLEGTRYDGAWDGDQMAVAQYAIASWCQELGWAPDLTGYEPGEQVAFGDEIDYCNAAFYGAGDAEQEEDNSEDLGELVDGHERGVVAIIREGIKQHRGNVYDATVPMTKDELDAAADVAKAVEDVATEGDDA
ncbi:hypothetical protein ACFQMF_01705 [Halorubrum rutilum]|uniref:Uncharacterized protein n=1 Tax=Halorubrum rutilum TaxID=1364933 RepID=A0ABD6AGI4_9EURY|nr:hypothetical protein [Halorubrum rutilum]